MKYAALSASLLLAACSVRPANTIVIGSKNFTEQVVLGEMLAQRIADTTPLRVERRFYLGGTYICQQSLLAGRIDGYVEYTGTALAAVLKERPSGDAQSVYQRVKKGYAARYHLAVLPPLGFNNSFALVIRGDDARRLGVHTISEAARYTPHWRAGFGYEFMDRPDGYAGLVRAYGLKFAGPPKIMDLGLLYRALISRQVDLIAGNTTDGQIEEFHLAVLQDDRRYFPPYQAVPIFREQTLRRFPELRSVVGALAGKVSDGEMRRMNFEVVSEHKDAAEVVGDFLRSKHLDSRASLRRVSSRSSP
ncbi:MAG: glycine betaine ABC transporter substrate-binding protein [Terriglobia bacterium]